MGIKIKGLTVPALLIKLDPNMSLKDNLKGLSEKMSSTFFKGSYAVVDYNGLEVSDEEKKDIETLLKNFNTNILGYQNNKSEQKNITINQKKSLKIINKTLRSGQKVEYDGDVVILGDVNPDAYIIASGSVVIMGALRGVVHAGTNGDETAVIMALKLKPQQIRIGHYIARAPDNMEEVNHPEIAFIEGDSIIIEKI